MIVLQHSQFNLEQFGTKARLWLQFKSTHMLPPALLEPRGKFLFSFLITQRPKVRKQQQSRG